MSNIVTYTYDPADLVFLIGTYQVEAWGSDSMVTITRDGDANNKQVGVLGDVTVNRNRDQTGTVSITLKAQSIDDKLFDEIPATDGLYAFPLVILFPNANKQLVTDCWYIGNADLAAGAQLEDRTHVLGVSNAIPSLIDNAESVVAQLEKLTLS